MVRSALIVVFDEDRQKKEQLYERSKELAEKKPLSKFGVDVDIMICNAGELPSLIADLETEEIGKFWVYLNGKVHQYAKGMSRAKCIKYLQAGSTWEQSNGIFPPVISDLKASHSSIK